MSDTTNEDSHAYTSELVENMPHYWISGRDYRPIYVGGLDSYYINIGVMQVKIISPLLPLKHIS